MQQQSLSLSSNTRHQFIRDALESAKQRLLTRNSSNASSTSTPQMNPNFMEIIVGVGYMLLVFSFLVKIILKTLGRFESHFRSSHGSNLFGFIANEDSDYESYSDSDHDDTEDEEDEEEEVESPVSLRPTLAPITHAPMTTPMHSIIVDTPQTPYPPAAALRRSMRLKIKSELNLTSIEKQNRTNAVTQTQRNQYNFTNEKVTISSAPPSYVFRQNHENKLKRRSRFNSPLVVRRLIL